MLVNNSNNNSNTIFYRHFSPSSTQYVAILCTACVLCLWWWESLWVNMFCNGWNSRVKYIDINMRRIPHRGRAHAFINFTLKKRSLLHTNLANHGSEKIYFVDIQGFEFIVILCCFVILCIFPCCHIQQEFIAVYI